MQHSHSTLPLLAPGLEVIVVSPNHPKHDAIGVVAGLADTLGPPRVRVAIDAEIFLFRPGELIEN